MDILIVDDSAAVRKILGRILHQTDLVVGQIYEADDGAEALECLRSNKVQLILSDINMPNMDGLELLVCLKRTEFLKDIPVIMVTTEGSQTKVMEAIGLGAAGYIRKPFTADQVKEKLAIAGIIE